MELTANAPDQLPERTAREQDPWPAPTATAPVDATVQIPGSKSLTNRYLVLAALADGPSRLRRPLRSRDTLLMASALRSLGVEVEDVEDAAAEASTDDPARESDWVITPGPLRGPARIDAGLAGTVMRFLPPVAALARGRIELDGDARARQRPMAAVVRALDDLGVQIEHADEGRLPLVIHGTGRVRGGEVTLDASASSQFVSGLLLAAPRFAQGLTVRHVGPPMPSQPHVAMTVEALRDAGVLVDDAEPNVWRVLSGPIGALDVHVEPDLSNAAPFLAAAAVTGGRISIPGWPQHTTQAGDMMRDLLDAMGAEVALDQGGLSVSGTGELYGLDADLRGAGELTPIIAALAALASSPSHLHGIAHLRGHETDRLAALSTEINNLGGRVTETDDGLQISPVPLHGGVFATYDDHRMATAGALIGLVVPGVQVENIATTGKTLPHFVDLWSGIIPV